MSTSGSRQRPLWLLPIVLAICAVMVLPAGAGLSAASVPGSALAAAEGIAAPAAVAPATPSSPGLPSASSVHAYQPDTDGTQTTSAAAALSSGVSPMYADAPWVKNLEDGDTSHGLTSVPNLAILKGDTSVSTILPEFTSTPAPLGLADYGLGAQTYSYNTSHILGQVVFNSPPNATNPGATGLIGPSTGAQHQGYIGSPYTFGIQLNTIATNITAPGGNSYFFWTQNVVNWNNTGIHFVDDTFNASGGYIGSGVILSGCNNNSQGVDNILDFYGGVFQCVGGTVPISAASYPITLQLYNNASTNAEGQSVITYGYNILEAGTHVRATGISDTIVFNNPAGGTPPTAPGFTIDGFSETPGYFYRDAEIVIVGGIGGDNADFNSINGTISLEYSNQTAGGFRSVPSAYNWGDDTGESSVGIADYWTPAHTLVINQGPALLYGLWGSEPQVAVASGDIHLEGSIDPSYGFVFVGNQAPGVFGQNLSWLPTNGAGDFNTYLPPLGGDWATAYYVQAWADGYDELNGTPIVGSTTGYNLDLTSSPGNDQTPIYMDGNAQAAALSAALGGSTAAPYNFTDLEPNVNITFNRVNDYTYPTFTVFQAIGVTHGLNVSGVYQGYNSNEWGWTYWYPEPFYQTGLLTPAGQILAGYDELEYFSSQLAFLDDTGGINVTNYEFFGAGFFGPYAPGGSMVELWQTHDANITDSFAVYYSQGVWIGDSTDATVADYESFEGATGVSDVGSSHTTVDDVYVNDALGIWATASVDGSYSYIEADDFGAGIETGYDAGYIGSTSLAYYSLPGTTGLAINQLYATDDSLGANLTLSIDTTITNVTAFDPEYNGALLLQLDATDHTSITNISVDDAGAVWAWNVTDTSITNLSTDGYFFYGPAEVFVQHGTSLSLTNIDLEYPWDYGVLGLYVDDVSITNATVEGAYAGVIFAYGTGYAATDLYADDSEFAFEVDYRTGTTTFSNALLVEDYIGINLYMTSGASVTNATVIDSFAACDGSPYCAGIASLNTTGNTFSKVTATDDALGVRLDFGTTDSTLTTVNVTEDALGVEIDNSNSTRIADVNASGDGSGGVQMDEGSVGLTVTNLIALDGADGLYAIDSSTIAVNGVFAQDDAQGVILVDSTGASVTTVTAELDSDGVFAADTPGTAVRDVTASGGGSTGVLFLGSPDGSVTTVAATDYALGVGLDDSADTSISGVTASDGGIGIVVDPSPGVTISGVSASDQAVAVVVEGSSWDNITDVSATDLSVAVEVMPLDGDWWLPSTNLQISDISVSDLSIGVWVYESGQIAISDVTATGTTATAPWDIYSDAWDGAVPVAAVLTDYTYQVQISNIVATNYPIGLYDYGSGDTNFPGSIYLQGLTSTGDYYAMVLNYTDFGYFNGVSSSHDWLGVWEYDTYENDLLGSSFIGDTSYGVSLWYAEDNYVWDSTFIGDNGATDTYSAAHIQAYSGYGCGDCYNYFDSPVFPYTGNYWADWHSWNVEGELNPYYVGDQNWDYSPLYAPANETAVWFYEDGLTAGTSWSVTFDGATQTSANSWIVFAAPSGSYDYTVGAVAGYVASPSSGTVATGTTGDVAVYLAFSPAPATTSVTIEETGLPAGTPWTAAFGGALGNATGSSITFVSGLGTFSYQIGAVAGYAASPSGGSVTVGASGYTILVTFSEVTYAVTITASGLAPGVTWSATVNGVTQSTSGASLTWYVPNGTYAYSVTAPSGYTVSGATGNVVVNGAPGSLGAAFTSTSTTAYVTSATFNTFVVVALIVAVIALVLALLAVLTRRRSETPPPAEWTGPTPSSTESPAATPSESGTGAEWDEQASSGSEETPPPSS